MKKIILSIFIVAMTVVSANAQTKKVSILGDSYSTFEGCNPDGYAPFYPNDRNDVKDVSQTWWSLYNKAMGYTLEVNDSWGGTTVCNTGYGRWNVANSSFNSRLWKLGNPDIIFVFGGTNDAWAGSPVGEYKYSDISKEDCNSLRPAIAYMLDGLSRIYPKATINPLGDWTGGINVDSGATNRKLGSDMGDAVTGGGLHGKDLSKADVSVNIYAHLLAERTGKEASCSCAIGDNKVKVALGKKKNDIKYVPFEQIVNEARNYIKAIGGFEKFAEWGLIRPTNML